MVLEDFEEIMNLQRQLASRVVQENEMEMQLKILEIIQSSVKDKNKQVQKASILAIAEMEGIREDQTERILNSLENMNYIRTTGGYIRLL